MSRYRLLPAAELVVALAEHCRHARFVWNLAAEQQGFWRPGRKAPGYNEQAAQLTEARAAFAWLAAGSQTVLSRPVPEGVKSYRITRDRAGRWHIAFAHVPDPIADPQNGSVVGIDRGVAVSAALSTGELLRAPGLTGGEAKRLKVLQRRLSRAQRGSNRRAKTKLGVARLRARETDRRKDWVEKISTTIARRFETIRIEALDVRAMTRSAKGTIDRPGSNVAQKRALNRSISRSGWGLLAARLQHKALGRVEQVPAAYTSQRCSACGHTASENRKSQAVFACVACTAGPCNADVNAARNIAAGRAVTARGDLGNSRSVNREPQLESPAA